MKAHESAPHNATQSKVAVFLVLAVGLWGCRSGSTLALNEHLIRQSDDPKDWPFSVPEGILSCSGNPKSPGLAAVTFKANGITYGLNGGALSGDAYPSADPITPRTSVGLYKGNYGKYLGDGLNICAKVDPALWGNLKQQAAPPISGTSKPHDISNLGSPGLSAKAMPSTPSLEVSAKLVEPGLVEFTVKTNLPTPLAAMASLNLQGQKDQDTAIGTSHQVTLTGPTTTFTLHAIDDDDGMDGKTLPTGRYDAEVIIGPKWAENISIATLPKNIENKHAIVLNSGRTRAMVERQNDLQKWVIDNVPSDAAWNEQVFKTKLGPYEKSVSTLSSLHDAYYFPDADMTLIVNRLRQQVSIWRVGRSAK